MTRRLTLAFVCVLVLLAAPHAVRAEVTINEALFAAGNVGSGLETHDHEWVELYNTGPGDVDLTGWTLTNRDASPLILLPPWALPAGTYLTVHLAPGTNDDDFDDWDGHYYAGGPAGLFDDSEDECALYSGVPGAGTIIDFVSWSGQGSYTPGTAHAYATSAGIWTAGEYLDTQDARSADTIARYFDGFDRNLSADWRVLGWPIYIQSSAHQPENPIQVAPKNRSVTNDTSVTFDWSDFPGADSYELQVDNDLDFSSPAVNVGGLASSQYGPVGPLADDVYFYRIRAVVAGSPTPWAAEWSVVVDSGVPDGSLLRGGPRNAPHLYQRKDTNLLCIWHQSGSRRPGCPETGDCAWDIPHPNGAPDVTGCEHGQMYCVPTSIAMMNHAYGGDLKIDRVSYQMNVTDRPEPEGDLGHDDGYAYPPDPEEANGLAWALNGAAITVVAHPTFAQIKGWVDDRGCFMARVPGHMVVIDDYFEYTTPAGTDVQIVYSQDPWNGPWYRYVYRYVIAGAPSPHWARRYSTTRFAHAFLQPTSGVSGRMQEAAVTTDSDGDGIMDFDEGDPRNLHCHKNKADTDRDEVPDKNDIRNYTFHDTHHAGHNNDALTFSDWDQDGLRSENDCDSDGRDAVDGHGDFDGGEDIDGDGHNPEAGETCMFNPALWLLSVNVDKDSYLVGEPVYIVDVHGSRETHTYHASSAYWYELGGGCPDKANGTPLGHSGIFGTDAGGHAFTTFVMRCPKAGQYYLTVDVLGDFNYSEPDNTDPQTCWTCLRRVWDCVYTNRPGTTFGPSTWTRDGQPVGTTFPEGVTPVPGVPQYDSTDLPVEPNDWHWYVDYIYNGLPTRTYVSIVNFPEGASIKIEIVCSLTYAGTETSLAVDVGADQYAILDGGGGTVWQGLWSQYPQDIPPSLGFSLTGDERQNFLGCPTCPGDMDGSNVVDIDDIVPFVDELLSPAPSHCADVNGDLKIDGSDIQPMAPLVLANGGTGTPCPAAIGACCLPDTACVDGSTEADCAAIGGLYQGDGTSCADIICTPFVCIPPGIDCWSTACNFNTFFSFIDTPLPADFFHPGCLPFEGTVFLGSASGPGGIDTLMARLDSMCFPEPLPSTATVPIELVQLNLVSCQPITVTYEGGASELWDVSVGLSPVPAPQGTMTVTQLSPQGGEYDADFFVQPVFVFTQVGNPTEQRILDTGLEGIPAMHLGTTGTPWLHNEPYGSACSPGFAPGFTDQFGEPCCVESCHSSFGTAPHEHCVTPPECPMCDEAL